METKKRRYWTAKEMPGHPGYWGIAENDGQPSGPMYSVDYDGKTARERAEAFAAKMNLGESREPEFGRD